MISSILVRFSIFSFVFGFSICDFNRISYTNKNYNDILFEVINIKCNQNYDCDLEAAIVIGTLYVLSSPQKSQSEIQEFVSQYAIYQAEDSKVISCIRSLGNSLVNQGTQNFNFSSSDENQIRGNVMDMCSGTDLDGISGQMADNIVAGMREEALQPIIIGHELQWLASVLPRAANNDWAPYLPTGTYFIRMAIQQASQINAIIELYGAFDPQLRALYDSILPEMNQWIDNYGMWYIFAYGSYLGVFQ